MGLAAVLGGVITICGVLMDVKSLPLVIRNAIPIPDIPVLGASLEHEVASACQVAPGSLLLLLRVDVLKW